MAGGAQRESTELRMTNRLAKFGSMTNDGIVELEWENGQILMRRHSSSHRRKAHVTNDTTDGNCNTKRPRLQALDSGMERSPLSLRDDYQYGEMFTGLYSNNFSKFFKNGRRSSYDEDIMEYHVVPGSKSANPQPAAGGSSGLGSEMPQVTTGRKRRLHQGCSHKCKETVLFEGSILNGSQAVDSKIGFLNRKFQHLDARPDRRHFRFPNSSHFFRPPVFLEADDSQNRASTRPESCPSSSRVEELKTSKEKTLSGGSNPFKSTILVELTNNGSTREERSLNQPVPTKTKMEQHSAPAAKPHEGPPSDEQSEAVANENAIISKPCPDEVHFPTPSLAPPNGKPDARKYRDQLPETTSICSLVASNDPASSFRTVNEGAGGEMAYENEEVEEEPGGDRKAGTSRVSGGKGKRKRTAEVRNRFERKRRDKINKKMRALQELLPKTGKVDKASMLDKAIEYLKTLQLQVQLMSIGTSLCMAPLVLPVGMQHLAPPHLTQFPPLGMGMDMREHMGGIGCSQMPYPTSPVLGLRNPMLSSAVLQAPAPGIPGGPATHTTPPAPGIPGVSAPGDFPVSGPLLGSNNAIQNINSALINNGDITRAPISHDELIPQISLFQQSQNRQLPTHMPPDDTGS